MATRGTSLPVLLVCFALMAGGFMEGVTGSSSSFVRRRLASREELDARALASDGAAVAKSPPPPPNCSGFCNFVLPTCCPPLAPGLLPYCANTLALDVTNCGGCGVKCNPLVNPECCFGKCTNILTDASNCGLCGRVCPPSFKCVFGLCEYSK